VAERIEEKNEEAGEEVPPVVVVEVRSGISEDGGGVMVMIRSDGESVEKIVNLAYSLFLQIAQNGVERKERKEKAKEVI